MPEVDVVDSTWIGAAHPAVAAAVADPLNWRRWWPGLDLVVSEARGLKGVRWIVRPGRDRTRGTMEIWLEPAFDGVVLHYFLRLESTDGQPVGRGRRQRLAHAHRTRAKRAFWALADQLDPARTARVSAPSSRSAAGSPLP
jgi:hypothetical protein